MKLKLIVIFCLFSSILFAQTKADLCKSSIKSYCKKNYSLYKPVEFSRFKKSEYTYLDNTVDIWLDKLLNKKNEIKDSVLIKKINNYLSSTNTVRCLYGYLDKIENCQINGLMFNRLIFYNKYNSRKDSILVTNFLINDEFVNKDENNDIINLTFISYGDSLTIPAYSYVHIYEALTKGGTKRYFSSLFYLDTKTYKVLDEVEL